MKMSKNIFRAYDIRGIYNEEFDDEFAYYLGKAYGSTLHELGKTKTLIAHDNRISSPSIYKNLIKGIIDTGINVVSLGLVTTPMYYFASNYLNINCGIMVTASHNPKEYNGFKISYNGLYNAYGEDVYKLYEKILSNNFKEGNGTITEENITIPYINLIKKNIKIGNRKLKVVYDCGNGTTSIIAKEIFNNLGNITFIPTFDISDGTFPNHHPDPSVEENLSSLKQTVIDTHADVGIAFDGDGDRVGVVSEKGQMIDIDKYMIIIWRDIVNKITDKRALYDVKCSKTLSDELDKLQIKKTEYRTGNSYMKAKMVEDKFPFGGELSGHVFFQDKFPGYDDGIYAGLRLIEILSNTNKTTEELLSGINKYYNTKELKVTIEDTKKEELIKRVGEYCKEKNYTTNTIDGVKVLFETGFALIRASNTGPNITLRYEAKTEEELAKIIKEFTDLIDKIKKEL